ncbi:putative quinol monooxygenase [Schlesneria paludicola]|uniref:putative quinol monooxygenase n=1 Tax=Schlesneria paludicola TaxID=360056 RepID=UPI00029AECAE|nr:putative quinol monooxygenase [Schlesneria paludicola]
MIYINVVLTVKDAADIADIQALLSEQGRLSRQEPGCLRFEVYHSQTDPRVFLLNEHWADQAAIDAHRKATAYTTIYQPKVLPRVERVPHPSDLVS